MIVSIDQIQNGVVRFIENEISAKAVGFDKFKVNFVLPKVPKIISDLMVQYKDNILLKEYFDENGNVKLNELYNSAKTAMQKSGQFTFAGLIFKEADVDLMYEYIKSM
jgi:hypothetical protein